MPRQRIRSIAQKTSERTVQKSHEISQIGLTRDAPVQPQWPQRQTAYSPAANGSSVSRCRQKRARFVSFSAINSHLFLRILHAHA